MNQPDFIFGIRAVIEALNAEKEIDKILIKRDLKGDLYRELNDALTDRGIPVQKVPIERINRLTRKNHQGVVAWISQVIYHNIETLLPQIYESGRVPFILVLDGVTDVRNFGAIARTAECAGVDAIVIPATGSATITSDAVKTSAGALHTIPVCRVQNLGKTLRFLQESGLALMGSSEKGDVVFKEIELTGPLAVVMGAEDRGLSPEALRVCDRLVSIPMKGTVGSLNVSVAAGIFLFEVVRQRE